MVEQITQTHIYTYRHKPPHWQTHSRSSLLVVVNVPASSKALACLTRTTLPAITSMSVYLALISAISCTCSRTHRLISKIRIRGIREKRCIDRQTHLHFVITILTVEHDDIAPRLVQGINASHLQVLHSAGPHCRTHQQLALGVLARVGKGFVFL